MLVFVMKRESSMWMDMEARKCVLACAHLVDVGDGGLEAAQHRGRHSLDIERHL